MEKGFYYETKIGTIGLVENGEAITYVCFGENLPKDIEISETPLLKKANEQLQEYLNGKRKVFDLPLEPKGTAFQQKVWEVLREIPYGTTCSYKDIAEKIGNPKACRAVGMANNRNPISIFIPCHRVIGANGKLVGYGGGLDIKAKLLEIERHLHGK
ncbi:methylated-DNA--[protein]-cysteine S-methyltransferase [Defluviitalea saccharophila]|uniref:Methylated-DNA--protein-cysteine methyltransferase n=1 Tax=Defluviitalea saccharophila TaxID=879970 RepID=A0ABZ2Y1Z3_9FIRM|nr:methylated-DNA--[protein]-cysteine S-methyltransferase [Candidatus Epulonipiscium sp.]